jgi:hypothetical protein
MSFSGQNQTPDDNSPMNFDNADMPPPPGSGTDDDDGGGIMQWLEDSYNGLYKVVIEPSMPTWQTIILLCVGLFIGLVWGYLLFPVEFSGAAPNRLTENAQEQWIRMVAVGSTNQVRYTPDNAITLLEVIPNPQEEIQEMLSSDELPTTDRQALQNLQNIVQSQEINAAEPITGPGFVASTLQILLAFLLVLIVTPILVVVWRLLIYPNVVAGAIDRFRQMTDTEYREQRERDRAAQEAAREQAEFRRKMREESSADEELGEPVMQNLSIFDPGRNYDDSFEIELPQDQGGDFLGQCGAAVSPAVTEPVAVEIWLFDMFSQQNLKKVFVTETAWNDPSIKSRLMDDNDLDDPQRDIQVAGEGASLVVDSDKLRLKGTLQDLTVTPDGKFESFKMPVVAWQKGESSTGAPPIPQSTGSPSMSEYDDIEFDPPPQMPSGGQQSSGSEQSLGSLMGGGNQQPTQPNQPQSPSSSGSGDDMPPPPSSGSSGGQRLEPPPLNIPPGFGESGGGSQSSQQDDDDDDPFGGTGDFRPLSNR